MAKTKETKKSVHLRNPLGLSKEFYQNYDIDYWNNIIDTLRFNHDSFEELQPIFEKYGYCFEKAKYQRTMRVELHFLYFKLVESLFEMIFAIYNFDGRMLWLALSLSNKKDSYYYSACYKNIERFATDEENFRSNMIGTIVPDAAISGESMNIPFLRYLFYFNYPMSLSDGQWKSNLDYIESALIRFATDFTKRDEYNAYKHSLRVFASKSAMGIVTPRGQFALIHSEDSISYLSEYDSKSTNNTKQEVGYTRMGIKTKKFDFETDYHRCKILQALISNIIISRKNNIISEKIEDEIRLNHFAVENQVNLNYPSNIGVFSNYT